MNVFDAVARAEELIEEFGLNGWVVALDRSKVRFGCCRHRNHTISLSRALVELNSIYEVEDVIRHELAHALAGEGAGHGTVWKSMCYRTGARPEACYNVANVVAAPSKYVLYCPNPGCTYTHPRHRRTARKYIHRTCGTVMMWAVSVEES